MQNLISARTKKLFFLLILFILIQLFLFINWVRMQNNTDLFFMRKALIEAKKAFDKDEVPIGAIVVGPDNQTILATGHNLVQKRKSQLAHAEMLAIAKASKKMGDWRLNECTLFVTLEPCSMCMNFILLSRISTVIFALRSKIYGYKLDKHNTFEIYKCPVVIKEGVCKDESLDLLKKFFQKKRNIERE